jgi:TRAP-type uncharacterized transport system fused permease subunit
MADPVEGSRFRRPSGILGYWKDFLLISVPAIGVIAILNLPLYFGLSFYIQQYLGFFFGLIMALVFILIPFKKGGAMDRLPWYDLICSLAGLVVGIYLGLYYKEIVLFWRHRGAC